MNPYDSVRTNFEILRSPPLPPPPPPPEKYQERFFVFEAFLHV